MFSFPFRHYCLLFSVSGVLSFFPVAIHLLLHLFEKAQGLDKGARRLFSYCQLLVCLWCLVPILQLGFPELVLTRRGLGGRVTRFVAFPMGE